MASPSRSDEDQLSIDPSEPFKGIVVCCTSIPPEYRTEIAQKVLELGGTHKYDLTPDVTHLIVGDYDTPKYRHVARERPDIRAMDASWVDAMSELWKNDSHIDFLKLEREHQLRPLETKGSLPPPTGSGPPTRQSLLVCLTGFGQQRDEIAEKIINNGGRHTDDLTRRCTHLIVSKPEGKKFTAAKSWNIRTVTLDWLEQSVLRGMILEEERFDPLLPPEEQGVGAWVKKDPRRQSLGKRSRSALSTGPENGTRKLRKTASMKLSSQRNNLWGDILGRSDSREYSFTGEEEPTPTVPVPQGPPDEERAPPPPPPEEKGGIFSDCIFYIHGFEGKRNRLLSRTVTELDGLVAPTLAEAADSEVSNRFLIVPQESNPDQHPQVPHDSLHVVTEFYVEKCMHSRQFFPPGDHVLGRPFPVPHIDGFESLSISSTAFTGIELHHVAKSVKLLGAHYEEQFQPSTSVLVCKSLEATRQDKLQAARSWGVPVVSAEWLWECISTGYNIPMDSFIFPEFRRRRQSSPSDAPQTKTTQTRSQPKPTAKASSSSSRPPTRTTTIDRTAFEGEPVPNPTTKSTTTRGLLTPREDSSISAEFNTARTHPATSTVDPPLTELSSASINKSPSPPKTTIDPPATTTTTTTTKTQNNDHEPTPQENQEAEESKRQAAKAAERQALATKLTTLLDSTSGTAPATTADENHQSNANSTAPRPRRRQILGRAISNASAGSSASAPAAAPPTDHDGPTGEEHQQQPPPQTQIEYDDPEAQGHKAALMDRMMGGTGKVANAKTNANPAVVGGRSMRRR